MSNFYKRTILALTVLLSPAIAFSATSNMGFDGLNLLILQFANGVVRSTGYMMFTLAVVVFFFGIVQFIWTARQGAEGKGLQKGTQFIKWGLIAIFIMFSLWGIITFTQGVFGIQGQDTITVPSLNFRPASGSPRTVTGGTYTATQAGASQNYNNCIAKGGNAASCQGTYQSSGGAGSGQQSLAQQAYNTCIGNGNTSTECQTAYQAYGGTGSGTQNLAQTAYNTCIGNGNTATECQAAYTAYGGTGSGTQNLAQDAYSICLSNGNSASECQAAYTAYGGTGTPSTQANSNGVCPTGYVADDSSASGCSATGGSTSGGTGSCGSRAQNTCDGNGCAWVDNACLSSAEIERRMNATQEELDTKRQYRDTLTGGGSGWYDDSILYVDQSGDIQYNCDDLSYCG